MKKKSFKDLVSAANNQKVRIKTNIRAGGVSKPRQRKAVPQQY